MIWVLYNNDDKTSSCLQLGVRESRLYRVVKGDNERTREFEEFYLDSDVRQSDRAEIRVANAHVTLRIILSHLVLFGSSQLVITSHPSLCSMVSFRLRHRLIGSP